MKIEDFIQIVLSIVIMLGSAAFVVSTIANDSILLAKIGSFIVFILSAIMVALATNKQKK